MICKSSLVKSGFASTIQGTDIPCTHSHSKLVSSFDMSGYVLMLIPFLATACIFFFKSSLPDLDVSRLEELPSFLRNAAFTIAYLSNGAEVIAHHYGKSQGKPFVLRTPGKQVVVVSSRKHIKELNQASPAALSMHAMAKELMQPLHTMQGFDMNERRGLDGLQFVNAIRKDFTPQLPRKLPMLERAISDEFAKELKGCKVVNGKYQVKLYSMVNRIIARANCVACFGEEIASDPVIVAAAQRFAVDCYISGEIIRAGPKSITVPIASIVTGQWRATRTLFDIICATVEQRRGLENVESEQREPVDGLQNIINAFPKDGSTSAARIAHECLGVFFFPVVGLTNTTTFALADLSTHVECLPPLREELEKGWSEFEKKAEGLPLLESFVKESTRLNGTEWGKIPSHFQHLS